METIDSIEEKSYKTDEKPSRRERPSLGFGATCPSCGGAIRLKEGERSVRCGYCSSSLLVLDPAGTRSFVLDPSISPAKARLAATHWIAEESAGRLSARSAPIMEEKLIYVPFWRLRGRIMGWLLGERRKISNAGPKFEGTLSFPFDPKTREEQDFYSRLLFKRIDWSSPACILPYLGLQGIALRTDLLEWDVLDSEKRRKRNVIFPTRSERVARRDAARYIRSFATAAGTTVRASRFELFDAVFSIYYYPVYILCYRHDERLFTITVDGANGSVVRGDLPKEKRFSAKRFVFVPAILALLAAISLPLLVVLILMVYAVDSLRESAPIAPKDWISRRAAMLLGEGN